MKAEWYALHVATGQEYDVLKICKRNFEVLLPRRKLKEQKNGKWKDVVKVLFPGYIFVKSEMTTGEYYKLEGISGVIKILRGANSIPTPIPEYEMNLVMRFCPLDDMIGISSIVKENDEVKVIDGPLVGMEGQIIKVDARRFRAKVRFTVLGNEKIVDMGVNVIKKS